MAKGTGSRGVTSKKRVKKRRAQGAAVAALNAFTAEHKPAAREGLGLVAPEDAISELADAADEDSLEVPRLFVLDSLVKLANRGEDLQAFGDEVDRLLEGLARHAGVPEDEVTDAAATARDALDDVDQQRGDAATAHPWTAFAGKAEDALRLEPAEVDKPRCNDDEAVYKKGHKARGVTVEFHTDSAPGEMRRFCDPTRWHEVSAYQHEMTPWKARGAISIRRANGWRRDLVETVELTPTKTLVTPLRFTYSVDSGADPDWVHLDYVLIRETADIAVDEGSLDIRRVVTGKQKGRTLVSAKKAIFFKDPIFQDWTSISCDTVWTDTVIAAAVDSAAVRSAT